MAMSNATKGVVAAVAAGVVIGGVYYLLSSGSTEPEIPSCPGCQYKKAFIGPNGTVSGTFTNVSPAYTRTDVDFGGVSPATAVPKPTESQPYSQQVSASRSITVAKMRFWYMSSANIEVYKSVNLPIK
jgi:hypothetical protein